MTDLRDRIASAIARKTSSKAPDEVLAEIAKTHRLVPNDEPMTTSWSWSEDEWDCFTSMCKEDLDE